MSDDDLMPWQIIQNLANERESWSDTEILAELRALPVLPDEDYFEHAEDDDEYRRMSHAYDVYLAIVDLASQRHLIEAIPLLLERASYGDFGETMRSLPNHLYHIADTGEDSPIERLRPYVMDAIRSLNPGARLWALDFLRSDNPTFIDILIPMLDDPAILVAAEAASNLGWFASQQPEECLRILKALNAAAQRRPELNTNRWSHISSVLKRLPCAK